VRLISIRVTDEDYDYINRQEPNRSEFLRKLIYQHRDMAGLRAVVEGLKRRKGGDEDETEK
jgi:hypothetical protein